MINKSDADWLHLDIMDGVFVPNISFGFPVLNALKPICQKPMDVHLMIVEPQKFIPEVAATGAYMMNVHYEACSHLHRTVAAIKETGMKAGVTLNPHTPICLLEDIIQDVDMVLLMSVNPGFGGQRFIEHSVDKVARLREMIDRKGLSTMIEVDGGVNLETGKRLVDAGAQPARIALEVYQSQRLEYLHLESIVMSRIEGRAGGRVAFSYAYEDDLRSCGVKPAECDGLIDIVRQVGGTELCLFLREDEPGSVRGNLRSKGSIDISGIAVELGGGGHAAAAGFTFKGTVEQAAQVVLPKLEALLQ